MSIPKRMRAELRWLAQQPAIVWGGVYKQGGHPEIYEMERRGFIEAVARPYTVGKLQFPGGYRITDAGREAVASVSVHPR